MAEKIRILHIEDNPLDAELIEAQLRSGWPDCDYALVCSEREFSAALDAEAVDIVLSDYSMPDFDGLAALSFVVRHSPETPVIFVTGAMGEEKAVETLKSGAADYILKSHLEKLVPSVGRVLEERKAREAQHTLEKQLSQATREWQATFDSISDSVALIDPDQLIIRCNRATTDMLGREYADLINQPCWKLFHGSDEPLPDCPMNAARRSLQSESSTILKKGRWLDITVDPILSDSGEMTGAVHVVRDVTERVQLINSVKEINELFGLFMKYSPIYAFIKEVDDTESRVLQASDNFREMIGIDAQEMIGKTMRQLFPPDFADTITADDQRVVATKTLEIKEEFLNDRSYITYKFPIERDDGKMILAGYTIDITERKWAEEELKKKSSEIEQFMYSVSHDLRSPLVTIKTFMGYLVQDMADGKQEHLAQDIDYIQGAADKMKLLLDELLEMSRIGRIEAPPVRVRLRDVLQVSLSMLAGIISERRVEIDLPGPEVMLCGDLQRLHQLWQNLIENAIKYCSDGTIPRIELGVKQQDGETVFFVRDNGIGIDPRYLDKIFGVFEKLNPESPGAGLGLPIIKRIVELYGGRIWVDSEGEGTGACFHFTLPEAIADDGGA
ncbi:MAG: PAS domain-containing protein [Geobacteraceae bacterium]|nr:PAS domain-containing protein [Geobacteraceae bacterium]